MKTYIGCKIIEAEPQFEFPDRVLPNGEDPLNERVRPGYAVVYADGYRSWSPKDVFEAAYREIPDGTDPDAVLLRVRAAADEPITGYRPLSPETVALINEAKALEEQVKALGAKFRDHDGADGRRIAIAATNIETGFMFLVKSVAAQDG